MTTEKREGRGYEATGELPISWSGAARSGVTPFAFGGDTRPWNWLELDQYAAAQLWRVIGEFVAFFNRRYGERAELRIPACWPEHGPLVEEITTLWWARWQAFESDHASIGGAQYWHTYTVPGFFERIGRWLGPDRLERCRQGLHEDSDETDPVNEDERTRRTEAVSRLDLAERSERRTTGERPSPVDQGGLTPPIPFLDRG